MPTFPALNKLTVPRRPLNYKHDTKLLVLALEKLKEAYSVKGAACYEAMLVTILSLTFRVVESVPARGVGIN